MQHTSMVSFSISHSPVKPCTTWGSTSCKFTAEVHLQSCGGEVVGSRPLVQPILYGMTSSVTKSPMQGWIVWLMA